jgi:hypothetical protein
MISLVKAYWFFLNHCALCRSMFSSKVKFICSLALRYNDKKAVKLRNELLPLDLGIDEEDMDGHCVLDALVFMFYSLILAGVSGGYKLS